MWRRPAAKALAWRFFFSLGGERGKEVGRAAITYSIFTLDPPKANARSHRTGATSLSQNTRSISARNNKMHSAQKVFARLTQLPWLGFLPILIVPVCH